MAKKIFLIGLMGSGKSYWKNFLSERYRVRGYDLDYLIESFEEQTIAEIFEEKGEEFFREKEAAALRWFQQNPSYILATGGGTPCFNDNIDWMNSQGITIWIDESISTLTNRLQSEKEHRPLISQLSDDEIHHFLSEQRWQRLPFYEKAQYKLNRDNISEAGFKKIIGPYE